MMTKVRSIVILLIFSCLLIIGCVLISNKDDPQATAGVFKDVSDISVESE